MKGFIEVTTTGNKHLVNIRYIEEVCGRIIYMAFNYPDAIGQDCFEVDQSYDEIVKLIEKAGSE